MPALHTAGIVEAVLTTTASTPEPSTTPSAPSTPSTTTPPLDEDLLSCVDVLAIAQSSRPEVAKDFDAAHNKFLGYVQKRYGLENIPISLGQTRFDPALGHNAATTVNNPTLPDDVIVGVLRDGYRRDHKIVRDAHVVVNKRDAGSDAVRHSYSVAQTEPQIAPPLETKPPDPEKPDDAQVGHDAGVIVNRIPSRVARLNKLVSLSRKQMYLEISARPDALIDEAILDADKQVSASDVIYSLLAIFALADPAKVRSLAEQLNNQTATGDSVRKAVEQIPSLHICYLRRTPEIYVVISGAIKPLDALRQILISEATRRSATNYAQTDQAWLIDLLHQLRPAGPTGDDYVAFANDIARRLEQITFTAELAAALSK
jgi:hypothetical protein